MNQGHADMVNLSVNRHYCRCEISVNIGAEIRLVLVAVTL